MPAVGKLLRDRRRVLWCEYYPGLVLGVAALLDYLIGDPWSWWHPVQGMGWVISRYTQLAFKWLKTPLALRWAGVGLGIGLILGSGWVGWLTVAIAHSIHPLVGGAIASVLLASCFAGRSLRDAAEDVLRPLQGGNLAEARSRLSRYVGRDTENLSEAEILRAILETVTENATDGILAPLFYAIVGTAILGVEGVSLALAYKAASTLDSMVGYREAPYIDLGWFSARVDDGLTWLPCRLVVLTLSLLSGKPRYVWKLCLRDAPKDPSPNSGWSECVYAATLGVQVGGTNWYRGIAKHKPLLGEPLHPITPKDVDRATRLTRYCCLIWLAGAIASYGLV
ncbi:MAG: cobalamin biosynthesis protein [Leptolyngbyaceae cyanobacterium RU_5_1]|nr:cobalamin biosynthesis protein [Leptolyngbyaceae cyanobacterium RU_5_1]